MKVDIYNTDKKYKTLYIDPPWEEKGGGRIKRGADRHYDTMSLEEIKSLPVYRLADSDGCHLYLWVTNNFLEKAFEVINAWGFQYITTITWQKDRMGLGQYYRGITEHCLFCSTKKRLPYKIENGKRCQGVTGFVDRKTVHSAKPSIMRRYIEKVSYAPYLELFARNEVEGWDCWGNEV